MALKVWLPLNGDLKNYGTIDALISSSAAENSAGKMGKCYSFNGTNQYMLFYQPIFSNSTQELSYSCWYKPGTSQSGAQCLFSQRNATGTLGFTIFIHNSGQILFDDGTRWSVTSDPLSPGNWYHLTFVRNQSGKFYYINGVLKASTTTIGTPTAAEGLTYIVIGSSHSNATSVGGNYLNGYLNDIRIYDNSLSIQEIKELSKGLVCHYKLNGTGTLPNLLSCTPRAYAPTVYQAYTLNLTENLVANQTYTLQFWDVNVSHTGKTAANLGLSVYWGGGSVRLVTMNGTNYFTNGHADYLKTTFTITSSQASGSGATNLWLNIYNSVPSATGTLNMNIGKWKLEKGSIATPWIPATTDNLYTTLGYNSDIIVDCSGNGYHGTKDGDIETIVSSKRYETTSHITSTSQYILTPSIPTTNFGNSYSISWWSKVPNFNNMQWGFIDGNRLNGLLYGNLWNTGDSSNNPIYVPDTTIQVTAPTVNTWHHYVMVGNGTDCRVYLDGELFGIAKTYKSINGTQITINGWSLTTSYRYSDLSISDFRLYSTALSADDAKELYQTAVKIDKLGNVHCYELQEG